MMIYNLNYEVAVCEHQTERLTKSEAIRLSLGVTTSYKLRHDTLRSSDGTRFKLRGNKLLIIHHTIKKPLIYLKYTISD